jgi:hypothetical protein
MRTTPSTGAFDNAKSLRPNIAESLGPAKTNRQNQEITKRLPSSKWTEQSH